MQHPLPVQRAGTTGVLALAAFVLGLPSVAAGAQDRFYHDALADAGELLPVAAADSHERFHRDTLTDANIAAIVVVANTADIENGDLAIARTSNEAVKAFARTMVTDHTAVNEQAAKLVTKLGVTPEASQASRDLARDTDAARAKIAALEGAAFDRAYVDNEVAYHSSVLKTIDEVLVPNATNAELKALLVAVRPAFVAHLEHAKKLQASLQG